MTLFTYIREFTSNLPKKTGHKMIKKYLKIGLVHEL